MMPYLNMHGAIVSSYMFMIFIALVFAWGWVRFSFLKIPLSALLFFIVLAYVSGFSLSVIFFAIFNYDQMSTGRFGLSFHGGIAGCVLATAFFGKEHKISFLNAADRIIPVGALSIALIRIGCFLAGCCRGVETQSIMGVIFPDEMATLTARHPVQLYDSLLNLYLFFYLFDISDRKTYDGQLFFLFLLYNSAIRFLVEYYRFGVSAQVVWGVVTQAQLASLGIIAVSLFMMRNLKRNEKERSAYCVNGKRLLKMS